jgi:hypothetical protein
MWIKRFAIKSLLFEFTVKPAKGVPPWRVYHLGGNTTLGFTIQDVLLDHLARRKI